MATEETENRESNAYFAELDAIAAKLDEAAKILTPDESDDGTPPDEGEQAESNSYFASFRNIAAALARMNEALAERIAAGGGIKEESDPAFKNWKDESYSLGIGKGAGSVANGVAIGWNSSAGAGTGTGGNDAGAVAVGKAAQAWGIGAAALGKGAVAGISYSRTTLPTVQLGMGQNANDGTLQFRDWQLLDATGAIPADRIPDKSIALKSVTLSRASSGFCNITNHAVNSITMTGDTVSFVFPADMAVRARSFILRITMQAATTWGFPPSTMVFESDDEDVFGEIEVGTTATFIFTEVSSGRFIVARKDTKSVTKPVIPI